MADELENQDPETWSKFPWQKAVIVLLSAISVLFGIIINSYRDRDKNHEERIEYLRLYVIRKEDEYKNLQKELYNCKDDQARYFRTQDSTNRAVLDGPAKELLKQLRK